MRWVSTALVACVAAVSLAGPAPVPAAERLKALPPRAIAVDTVGDLATLRQLEKEVEFSFEGTPIRDVLDFLRQVTRVNIVTVGADAELGRKLTLTLSKVHLWQALNHILRPDLRYLVRDGCIVIAPTKRIQRMVDGSFPAIALGKPDDLAVLPPLAAKLSLVKFRRAPLPVVLAFLSAETGSKVALDPFERGLESRRVSLYAKGLTGRDLLDLLLLPDLGCYAEKGVLYVTTRERSRRLLRAARFLTRIGSSRAMKTWAFFDKRLRERVSLDFDKTPLKQVMDEVRQELRANWLLDDCLVAKDKRPTTLSVRQASFYEVANRLAQGDIVCCFAYGAVFFTDRRRAEALASRPRAWIVVETPHDIPLALDLAKHVSYSFEGTPLKDVVDFLRQLCKVNFVIEPNVIAEDERLVTMTLSKVPLGRALNLVIGADLRIVIRDGAIVIERRFPE